MQRSFKLYLVKHNAQSLITNFSPQVQHTFNLFSTFDEKITIQDNDQATLTFSLMKYIYSDMGIQENYWLRSLTLGAHIRLIEDEYRQYDFIISSVAPKLSKSNVCYEFTCQDEVSYRWSRIKIGYSYSTVDRGGVANIYTIASHILSDCHLDEWDVIESTIGDKVDLTLQKQLFTFEIADSNPYNALIEACNSVNAQLSVNYSNKTLSFYQKSNRPFSGYRYRPEVNLSNLNVTYNSDNLSTILHVAGGTDEHDNIVTMVPYMPKIIQKRFLSNEYWRDTEPEDGWYSDYFYPPYWHHLTQLDFDNLETYLGFTSLKTDMGSDTTPSNMPPDFSKLYPPVNGIYDKYIEDIRSLYPTLEQYNKYIDQSQLYYADFYLQQQYSVQPATQPANQVPDPDWVPDEYKGLYTRSQYEELISKLQQTELEEFKAFIQIANKHMHLGQFLFDFNFFVNTGAMSTTDYATLSNLFNIKMRDNNIMLKIYTQLYQELNWSISQELANVNNYLEQVAGLYMDIYNDWQNMIDGSKSWSGTKYQENLDQVQYHLAQLSSIINKSNGLFTMLHNAYGRRLVDSIPEFIHIKDEHNRYINIRDESRIQVDILNIKLKNYQGNELDPEYIQLQSDYQYYSQKYLTAMSFCGDGIGLDSGYWTIYQSDSINYRVPSIFQYLQDQVLGVYVPSSTLGVYDQMKYYDHANEQLWHTIYNTYKQFIYEQKYENSDEIDSVNLYNQAIIYYADYNKPSASYTVETLDLGALEPIALPRLQVGYCIRVYNDYLNLNDQAVNTIQYANNELIITNISYTLRESQKVSIGVEQTTQYKTILQKLIKTIK